MMLDTDDLYKKVQVFVVSTRGLNMEMLPGLLMVVAFIVFMLVLHFTYGRKLNRGDQDIRNAGFEFCGYGSRSVLRALWVKNGEVYIGHSLESLVPVEIIKLSEITLGTRLHELEIRCRINGEIKSLRIKGGEIKSLRIKGKENELLTYMDRLGYS